MFKIHTVQINFGLAVKLSLKKTSFKVKTTILQMFIPVKNNNYMSLYEQ